MQKVAEPSRHILQFLNNLLVFVTKLLCSFLAEVWTILVIRINLAKHNRHTQVLKVCERASVPSRK